MYISSLAAVKHAAAQVSCDLGFLDTERATAIQRAAQEIGQGIWDGRFAAAPFQLDPSAYHAIVNSIIAQRATHAMTKGRGWARYWQGVQVEEHIDLAQSNYNVVSTAMRIGSLECTNGLLDAVYGLIRSLRSKTLEDDRADGSAQDLAGSLEHNAVCLRNITDGLRQLAWGSSDGTKDPNLCLAYQSRMAKRLFEYTQLHFLDADPSSGPAQFIIELASFLSALRALASTLTQVSNCSQPQPVSLAPTSSAGDGCGLGAVQVLEQARFHLQVCDMTVVLAAYVGRSEFERMLPVLACTMFEEMQALTLGVHRLAQSFTAGQEAVRASAHQRRSAERLVPMLNSFEPDSRVPSWVSYQ